MNGERPVSRRVRHEGGGRKMVKDAEREQADINSIIAKWIKTGSTVQPGVHAKYGDFTGVVDFHEAVNRVKEAEESFLRLPIAVKRACDQDPGKFLDLVYSAETREELEELGLVTEMAPADAPQPEPDPKPVTPPDPEP